jgi:hypothetical protein
LNPIAARLFSRRGRHRGRAAFRELVQVLQPFDLDPPWDSLWEFVRIAEYVEAWRSLEPFVEFSAVVARCHWHMLCSPVCRTALQRGKPVITFQQGVIDHTLDVPVTASRYVAFGRSSAAFLARMNHAFYQAARIQEPVVDFIPGGSLFDSLQELPNQFTNRTLLVIHDSDPHGFYGLDIHSRGVLHLVKKLLESDAPPRRVIIRLHPYAPVVELDPWKDLVREHPELCEISHPVWTLDDNFNRASVVVGNNSGALTVAAASGLPTFFVEPECFATEDLACFRNGQTFPADDALREIRRILNDPEAYGEARANALRNSREYYAGGANLKLDSTFFESMLHFSRAPASPASVLVGGSSVSPGNAVA